MEGDTFAGRITEIHAIFTYQNMVDGLPWERRWYLNGQQMAKTTDVWSKGNAGTFHLTLTAGGNPLGSGRWRLELYVNGVLLQRGEFVIEAPIPTPSATATLLLTSTPSPTAFATAALTDTPTAIVVPVYTIAFSRWDGGKYDLFLARTDGSGEKFLLQRAAGPSWSPDGHYLIFSGQEGVDRQERDGVTYHFEGISNGIISMDMRTWSPDLTTIVLRQHVREATARWAAWSPRGDMVAYDARRGGPDWRIYFLGTADNQQYQVEIPGEQADWSPDGNYLVYRSGRENRQGIWVSNRDDSSRVQITAEGSDAFPRWSPDGRKIAFHRDSGQNVDIYVMNPDGSHVRRLTDAPGPDTLPAWTPDGRIVFRSARSGSWGIYIMNADSSGQRLIIPNADPGPDWAFGHMDVR
ncbi:MAG: TolB family protein [Anaerolineae bacterium]